MGAHIQKFKSAVADGLKKWATFSGRTGRYDYFAFELFAMILLNAIGSVFEYFVEANVSPTQRDLVNIIRQLINLALVAPFFAVTTRRLHDIGRSGWWQLIGLTGVGLFLVIYWTCKKSTSENRFGEVVPDPQGGRMLMLISVISMILVPAYTYYQASETVMAVFEWRYTQKEDGPNEKYEVARRISRADNKTNTFEIAFVCANGTELGFVANLYERPAGGGDPVSVPIKIVGGRAGVLTTAEEDRAVVIDGTTTPSQMLADLPNWFDSNIVKNKKIIIKTKTDRGDATLTTSINDPVVERVFKSCGR